VLGLVKSAIAFAQVPKIPVTVLIKPQESNSFSLQITFTNTSATRLDNWGLGYFMFHLLGKNTDKLTLNICDDKTNCTNMQVVTNLSQFKGHINFITPVSHYPLSHYKQYVVTINGLTDIPQGISHMPQQLFLYRFDNRPALLIQVESYINLGYDSARMAKQQQKYISNNWNLSQRFPINSYILPSPQSVKYHSGVSKPSLIAQVKYCNLATSSQNQSKKYKLGSSISHSRCLAIKNQPEGYVLDIGSYQTVIYTNTQAGVFYAKQTLKQLNYYHRTAIPLQTIIDYPRFQYRGVMLDVARHFFSVKELEQLLDVMASHKLNTLHLHLADDEGFRLEIPNYPQLTQIGSKRGAMQKIPASNLTDGKYDITNRQHKNYLTIDDSYAGYYSQVQMKHLIQYANLRQITIIPEIEMPGHSMALKKALNISDDTLNASKSYLSVQGYDDNVLPVCRYNQDKQFTQQINQVVQSVANSFNQQTTVYAINNHISLAGDEVPSGAYLNQRSCQSLISNHLSEENISHDFFTKISSNLSQYKLSGWQQLVQDDAGQINVTYALNPQQSGYIWAWIPTTNLPVSGYTMAANLAKSGYKVVLDLADYSYFDIRYSPLFAEPGLYWSTKFNDTYKVLELSQAINRLNQQYIASGSAENIVGVEGALWTELVQTNEHLWYMMLPKLTALSQVAWAPANSLTWRGFSQILGCGNHGFLDYLNKNYFVDYRGYPHGIALEVPQGECDNLKSTLPIN
jgi:hexosaminidase